MLIRTHNSQATDRRGVILLVVISLLTLFAIVGLSFVLYANAEANASKIYREAANQNQIDMEPELLFNMFLGQLIYDVNDDYTGVYSAMRGHSLTRSMYGYNYPTPASPTVPPNTVPFNGVGRLHTSGGATPTYMNPYAAAGVLANPDDWYFVNYTYFTTDGFIRDPERLGPHPGVNNWRTSVGQNPGPFTGGFNVPYTYLDLNIMFLAAARP